MSTTDGAAFDCDTHIYEPRDAMTRYLPERFLDRSIRPIANAHGKDVVLAGIPHCHLQQRGGHGLRLRLPARIAAADAQGDGIRPSRCRGTRPNR